MAKAKKTAKKSVATPKSSVKKKSSVRTNKTVAKRATAKKKATRTSSQKRSQQSSSKTSSKTVSRSSATAKKDSNFMGKVRGLINFNKLMFALHAIQGIVLIAVSGSSQRTITTNTLVAENPSASEENFRLISETKDLFTVELAPLVALFFFLSAAAHFYVAFVARDNYVHDLKNGMNKARWFEYAASASLMVVFIAILSGVYDAGSLLGIFALSAVMNMMGLVMEVMNQGKKKISWLAYNIGCFAGIVPWLIIALTLWATQSSAAEGAGIPTFVFWIFASLFLFFNTFAINMVLQYKRVGRWKDYLYGEYVYMVLSLIAKSLLAWQVYGGTLQPV